jgi:methyltransferase (TIGR00027 family)
VRAERASATAQYVAAVRTVLTEDGVIDDPHAAAMLSPRMRAVVGALHLPAVRRWRRSPFFAALAARIAWFDAEVVRAADDGISQIVVVGAGFDSRAWRLTRGGVRFFEVDHPASQAAKRRLAPPGGPTYVPIDLAVSPIGPALQAAGLDAGVPALFVVEGVSMYLTEAEVAALLEALLPTAGSGSRVAISFAAPPGTGGVVERIRQPLIRLAGRASSEPHRSWADRGTAGPLVARAGWTVDAVVALRDVAPVLLPSNRLALDRINPDAVAVRATRPG